MMRLIIFVHAVSISTLCSRSVASVDIGCASPNDSLCNSNAMSEDSVGLLQARITEHAFTRNLATQVCQPYDHVTCPGSGVGCHGEQCCPGIEGGLNFPCPSAPVGWGAGYCQSPTKLEDCLELEQPNGLKCYIGHDSAVEETTYPGGTVCVSYIFQGNTTLYFGGYSQEQCEALNQDSGVTNVVCCDTDLCNAPPSTVTCYAGHDSSVTETSYPGGTLCVSYEYQGNTTLYLGGYSQEQCDALKEDSGVTGVLCCDTDLCNKPSS